MVSKIIKVQDHSEFFEALCKRLNNGTVYMHIANVMGSEPLYNRIDMLNDIFSFMESKIRDPINTYNTEIKLTDDEIDNNKLKKYISFHKQLKERKILCDVTNIHLEVNQYNRNGLDKQTVIEI